MPKPPGKDKAKCFAGVYSSATAVREGAYDAAASFRSPTGCTNATPGERDFLAWCQEERVSFPSSHITVLSSTGRALVASRAIKMGEIVVEVPDDAVLMADNCSIRDILEEEGMCKPADDEILEVQGLIIAVMYEKSLGTQSRWAPYLNLIPDDMTHMPLYWKRRELRELRGTAAFDKMMGKVQYPADAPTQVPLLWSEVVEPFIHEHPKLRLPTGKAGYDLYRWATCAVASYSFILGDDKYQAMVPVWDLLNHITGQVNVRLYHCARRHVLQMIATRDISQGEELVNNYGELSNAELLRGYGFVEAHNVNNHVQVPLGFVVRAATNVLQKNVAAEAGTAATGVGARAAGASAAVGAGHGLPSKPGPGVLRDRMSARLRLARRCGLLPPHRVFKVFACRAPPAIMTALIHVLLASDSEISTLRSAAHRAGMMAVAADQCTGRASRSKGIARSRNERGCQAAMQARTAAVVAAAMDSSDTALKRVGLVYDDVVQRMLGRYSCDVSEDKQLLAAIGRHASVPARMHAAVLARMPEKEALLSLRDSISTVRSLRKSLHSASGLQCNGPEIGGRIAVQVAASKPGIDCMITSLSGERNGDKDAPDESRFAAAQFTFGFKV
ncbi:hypothetical protein Vretimale_4391 [Volvox reticuliferus]|uniref:SET domain-containing protein n=1 Tax=Volvox reticuliferus TaxID=1737510 RepID=A0A8J4BZX1_9CHLO|nr:hypothetical protein Vretifemale_2984 [Volvox reticuliferus]GIL99128.1 hypothetical protein Vretimale_4391 [Volvox reticuliferus]